MPQATPTNSIAVLGSGSWGIALALLLVRNGFQVNLWGVSPEIEYLKQNRRSIYLPSIEIPSNIALFADVSLALQGMRDVLIAVPSFVFHSTLKLIKPFLAPNVRLFWGTKGLDSSDKLLHQIVQEEIGKIPVAVLSGPTFALEVARGLPTAITLAVNDDNFAKDISNYLHHGSFRVYTSNDLIGVQICGAHKNVLAIAVGMSDGLGFGSNARCALITRGLSEMMRLGKAVGGRTETFMGLAGLGDLVLTCTDDKSRNRRFGLAVGNGASREVAERDIKQGTPLRGDLSRWGFQRGESRFSPLAVGANSLRTNIEIPKVQVIEGISNAKAVYLLAQSLKVDVPITEQVYRILYENLSLQDAVRILLQRAQKVEN